jgi:hypothetical protein
MSETWAKEMERAVSYTIKAVEDLALSDAVNRQPEEVLRSLETAKEKLGTAIDSLETKDPD